MAELTTIEELRKKRQDSLIASEKAIKEHPVEYREIKKLVRQIVTDKLDISEYYKVANRLTRLLQKMMETGPGSVFFYFYQNIDPTQKGEVRYFRATCMDLYEQLKNVDQFRTGTHRIRLIQ